MILRNIIPSIVYRVQGGCENPCPDINGRFMNAYSALDPEP